MAAAKKPKRKNPVARSLAQGAFKQRVVVDKKKKAATKALKPKWRQDSSAE